MKGSDRVIDFLNQALKHELTAVSQFWLHYRLLDDWGLQKAGAKWRKELVLAIALDLQHRHLAERRYLLKPVRFVREVDIHDVEFCAFFVKRNDGPLYKWA